jgi:hypothetical protein
MHSPAKRGWLSLKLARVRDRVPPYRPSAKRWALASSRLNRNLPRLDRSTNLKSHCCSSSLPSSTAGTGRHMATDPCSPTAILREAGSSHSFALALTPLPVQNRRLASRPQEAFSCAFPCLALPLASKKPQSGAIAPAIAFAVPVVARLSAHGQSKQSVAVHQCGDAAVSCRLCLIA